MRQALPSLLNLSGKRDATKMLKNIERPPDFPAPARGCAVGSAIPIWEHPQILLRWQRGVPMGSRNLIDKDLNQRSWKCPVIAAEVLMVSISQSWQTAKVFMMELMCSRFQLLVFCFVFVVAFPRKGFSV